MNLVSIITPSYNSSQYIEKMIKSIISQTYNNWELLITDDCSTDDTWRLLNNYKEKDKRIRIFQLDKNCGPGIARNNSIKHAKGRFIAFCDSDDLWKPEKLENQIKFMLENNYYLTYSSYEVIDKNDTLKGIFRPPPKVTYKDLLKTCSIGCLTAVYDSKKLGKLYMPGIRKRQDYALWLEILKKIDFAYSYNEYLAMYRVKSGSVSSNKLNAARYQWRIYRNVENIGIIKSSFYMLHYTINGILKPN